MRAPTAAWCASLACLLGACTTEPINPVDSGAADAEDEPVRRREASAHDAPPPPSSGILVTGPALLSQTGLYSDFGARTIAPGLVEFTPRWPLWSDGADKRRWLQLPQGKTVDTADMNQWQFPIGTKLWKEFRSGGKVVETRFLWKQGDGWRNWWMGSYAWRQDGSDADYVAQGRADVLGTGHAAPSQVDCVRCHDGVADVGIGFSALQLSAPQNSQLALYSSMGLLSKPATKEYEPPGTGVVRDALTTLHANCGHCHTESSWLYKEQTQLVFRLRLTDVAPQDAGAYAAIGLKTKHDDPVYGAYAVYPGRPELSQAWMRMSVRDDGAWQMPPVGTKKVDLAGVAVVGQWITSLPPGADL